MTHLPIFRFRNLALFLALAAMPMAASAGPEPLSFDKGFAPSTIGPGSISTLTFTVTNNGSVPARNLAFTDNLPAGMTVAAPPQITDQCSGIVSAAAGSSSISFSSGGIGAFSSCTIQVDITSSTPGTHTNTTGELTSDAGTGGTATADLTVATDLPGFSKSFAPSSVFFGGRSTLTFTIDNSANLIDVGGLDFTDTFPAGLVVATPANVVNTCTGGTVTAADGSGTVSYTGGTVPASATCTLSIDVTSGAAGSYVNLTGELTSDAGNSGTATDTLTVTLELPTFVKAFAPDSIQAGAVSTLNFTIDNSANLVDVTSVAFTDTLPAGVVVATPANVANTCTGGTVVAADGSGTNTYTGGTVPAAASCTISVDITTDVAGNYVNLTGDLTSSAGNSGTATAPLTVTLELPTFAKAFAPTAILAGDVSTLTFTIDNSANLVPLTLLSFTDNLPAGLLVATPANAVNTCTGGSLSAAAGSGTISYTGGTVPASTSCTLSVDVSAAAAGTYVNTTGPLVSNAGTGGTATATLEVIDMLMAQKAFLASPILPGGSVDLEFTLSNPSGLAVSDISFSDDLNAVLAGMAASGLPLADPCGAGSQLAGTTVITLTGGSLAPGASCTFTASVVVPATAAPGTYTNTTSEITYTANSRPIVAQGATADLEVAYLLFAKLFPTGLVQAGSSTQLVFTIENPDPVNAATGLTFTDDLDAVLPGLEAIGLPQGDVCGAGSQLTGTSVIALTDGALGPGESCTFEVTVLVPQSASMGTFLNITSPLDGVVGGAPVAGDPASAAQANLEVEANILEIPTLGELGLLLLAALLALLSLGHLRRGGMSSGTQG